MFEFCLPVSHLIEQGRPEGPALLAAADVLEFRRPFIPPNLPDLPAVFHWDLGAVQDEFAVCFEQQNLDDFLRRIDASIFSFDLGPACRRSRYILPLSRTLGPGEIMDAAARNIDFVRSRYSGLLAAENYNYYPTGLYEHICRPDFVADFLERFDLGFVLDIPHAQVAAHNMRLNPREYLADLPLHRVVEVHLSRACFHHALAADAHRRPEDEEFELLEYVLERLDGRRKVLAVLEYYRDASRLLQAAQRLRAVLDKRNNLVPAGCALEAAHA